jgi:hypothetical protein
MTRWRQRAARTWSGVLELGGLLWNIAACAYADHIWYRDDSTDADGWTNTGHLFDGSAHGPFVTRQTRYCARCLRRQHRYPE